MRHILLALLTAALLAGCSSGPKQPEAGKPATTAAKETKPAELATGRVAFQRLFATVKAPGG